MFRKKHTKNCYAENPNQTRNPSNHLFPKIATQKTPIKQETLATTSFRKLLIQIPYRSLIYANTNKRKYKPNLILITNNLNTNNNSDINIQITQKVKTDKNLT